MHRWLIVFIVGFSFLNIGCQTSAKDAFSKVQPGMDKGEVLALMGNPSRTQRFHGKDRWGYIYYDEKTRLEKEVHFENGKTVYIGDVWEPPVEKSATVVDKKNEESNAEIDRLAAEAAAQNKRAFTEYEAQTKGNDKVRYLPSFQAIQ